MTLCTFISSDTTVKYKCEHDRMKCIVFVYSSLCGMVHTAITGTCDTITITVEVSDIAISE